MPFYNMKKVRDQIREEARRIELQTLMGSKRTKGRAKCKGKLSKKDTIKVSKESCLAKSCLNGGPDSQIAPEELAAFWKDAEMLVDAIVSDPGKLGISEDAVQILAVECTKSQFIEDQMLAIRFVQKNPVSEPFCTVKIEDMILVDTFLSNFDQEQYYDKYLVPFLEAMTISIDRPNKLCKLRIWLKVSPYLPTWILRIPKPSIMFFTILIRHIYQLPEVKQLLSDAISTLLDVDIDAIFRRPVTNSTNNSPSHLKNALQSSSSANGNTATSQKSEKFLCPLSTKSTITPEKLTQELPLTIPPSAVHLSSHDDLSTWLSKVKLLLEYIQRSLSASTADYRASNRNSLMVAWLTWITEAGDRCAPDRIDQLIVHNHKYSMNKAFKARLQFNLRDVSAIINYLSYQPLLLNRIAIELIFFNESNILRYEQFLQLGFADLIIQKLKLDHVSREPIFPEFVRLYRANFNVLSSTCLTEILELGIKLIDEKYQNKLIKTWAACCTWLRRYIDQREGNHLNYTEEHYVVPERNILYLNVPQNYGKDSELIFNNRLCTMYNIDLTESKVKTRITAEYDTMSEHSELSSTSTINMACVENFLKLPLKLGTPINKQLFFSGHRMIMTDFDYGFNRLHHSTKVIRHVLKVTYRSTRMVDVAHVKYCKAGLVVCLMASNVEVSFRYLILVNMRQGKILRAGDCHQNMAWPNKYYRSVHGIVGVAKYGPRGIVLQFFNTGHTEIVDVGRDIEVAEIRGDILVALTSFSIRLFSLQKTTAVPLTNLDHLYFGPFKQIHFLSDKTFVLASKFFGKEVAIKVTLEDLDGKVKTISKYCYLINQEIDPLLDYSYEPNEKYTLYFMVSASDRLLYASKIDRELMPYSATDPYSALRVITLPL